MAKGRKTGGRNFQPGDLRAGRPPGAKDKIPRSLKASIRRLYEEILSLPADREAIKAALRNKLRSGDFHHAQLAAFYLDGRPVERVEVEDGRPPFIIALREPIRVEGRRGDGEPPQRPGLPAKAAEEPAELLTFDPPPEEPPPRRWR